MSEKYFDADGRFAVVDDEEELIPAYAMIPAGGGSTAGSAVYDVYDKYGEYGEDTHGAPERTAVEYQTEEASASETGAYSAPPAPERF